MHEIEFSLYPPNRGYIKGILKGQLNSRSKALNSQGIKLKVKDF
jgi:hypothetical protein